MIILKEESMDINEMALRLSSLERARSEDQQKAAQQAFMDKYGNRISNNANLGLVILNELNRRNIDTSAADEAVTEILDNLRMEATALLDTIKENMDSANEIIDKVESMQEAVDAAAAATGADMSEGVGQVEQPMMDQLPPPEGGEMPPAEGEGAAMPPEGGEMPPAEGEGAAMPPEGGEMPPAPEEQLPPQNAISDKRMKFIKGVISDKRMKRNKQNLAYKLDPGIINACSSGF